MRFLGIGEEADLAGMYLGLLGRGHEVRMYVAIPEAHGIYAGMVERCADWRSELAWIREAGREGVIVFESASRGAEQDALRAQGYQVIGGSAYGDRLESDRTFGQSQLAWTWTLQRRMPRVLRLLGSDRIRTRNPGTLRGKEQWSRKPSHAQFRRTDE